MTDVNYAPVCGIYCGSCDFLGEQCKGCGYVEGRPFWTAEIPSRICPLHDCCRNQKDLEHCGLCAEFPCKKFLELRDPNMSDEEFQQSLDGRQKDLKRRMEVGTSQWLKDKSSS